MPSVVCRPPNSICRQCPKYTGPHPAHGDGSMKTTLGNAAAAVGSAVVKVIGMVTGKLFNAALCILFKFTSGVGDCNFIAKSFVYNTNISCRK